MLVPSSEPLGEEFRELLDGIAARAGLLRVGPDAKALAAALAELSRRYNDRGATAPQSGDKKMLAARLWFSLVRDVPKAAAAFGDVVAAGLVPARPLRVLDIGAGLGAMSLGLLRTLPAGLVPRVDVELADQDARALALAKEVLEAWARARASAVRVTTRVADASTPAPGRARYDVVLAGNVLSELDRDLDAAARLVRHEDVVTRWVDRLEDEGTLVIVEPALRDRARHLQALRDRIALGGAATLFAPCLHREPCPLLLRESDWCHEDRPVDLPEWLVPLARAAGLRYEGLTFSYLVLRRDGRRLGERGGILRDVSGLLRTKGKTERVLCGPLGDTSAAWRAMRLDRDESEPNSPWAEVSRGALLAFDPPLAAERPRVGPTTRVRELHAAETMAAVDEAPRRS